MMVTCYLCASAALTLARVTTLEVLGTVAGAYHVGIPRVGARDLGTMATESDAFE